MKKLAQLAPFASLPSVRTDDSKKILQYNNITFGNKAMDHDFLASIDVTDMIFLAFYSDH